MLEWTYQSPGDLEPNYHGYTIASRLIRDEHYHLNRVESIGWICLLSPGQSNGNLRKNAFKLL